MLRSKLFYIPRKDPPADAVTASHRLLVRASYFRPGHGAGLWETLPLGKRVLNKLQSIIGEEMDAIDGCQQVEMPTLMTSETWKKTGRWDEIGEEMFRLKDRKQVDMLLAPTHEEAFTSTVANMYGIVPKSSLPILLYQVGRKFRDELRPRAGLLRAREFIMKDLYSFDESQESAMKTYDRVCTAYDNFFRNRLKCTYIKAQADSGTMGGNYSHEFHFESDVGEDLVLKCDKGTFAANVEVAKDLKPGSACSDPRCSCNGQGHIKETKCIEVGHSFYLGTKYTLPLQARRSSEGDSDGNNKPKTIVMGSYGLGVTRIIAALVETMHDTDGINLPTPIAPFSLGIITVPGASESTIRTKFEGFKAILGSDVLLDDRKDKIPMSARIGEMKLMGVPYIAIVRKDDDKLEIIERRSGTVKVVGDVKEALFTMNIHT